MMLSNYYSIQFYPHWGRGPADHAYHIAVDSDSPFPNLRRAKKAAERVLFEHNSVEPDRRWRAEIYHHAAHSTRRSMNGSQIGPSYLFRWERAK
jgi:hypothetical protein